MRYPSQPRSVGAPPPDAFHAIAPEPFAIKKLKFDMTDPQFKSDIMNVFIFRSDQVTDL